MKQVVKDGWHTIMGYNVYVKDGKVLRGILGEGNAQRTAFPFRKSKSGGWDNDAGLSVGAFKAGVKRGSIKMY